MVKAEIVERLVYKNGIGRSTAIKAVDAVFDCLAESFEEGENVYIRGFATFKVETRKQKVGQDILKGKSIIIPERKTVKLILSDKVKSRLKLED